MTPYAAVITAGAPLDEPFASAAGTPFKALVRVHDVTLIERTIQALRDAGIQRIAVVAGDEVARVCEGLVDRVVPAATGGNAGAKNQWLALHAWEFESALLYATCDMPYVDSESVRWFLSHAPQDAVAMPLTEYAHFEQRFPGAPPFGVTLGGKRIVNGGLFAIPALASHVVEGFGIRLFNERKSPIRMARLAGFEVLLRFVLGNLGVEDLERRARKLLGINAIAVRNAPPELAYDIDTLAEYEYAAAHR